MHARQVSVVSTVIATLFLRTTLHSSSVADGQTYLGLIFFALIHMVRAPWLPSRKGAVKRARRED